VGTDGWNKVDCGVDGIQFLSRCPSSACCDDEALTWTRHRGRQGRVDAFRQGGRLAYKLLQ
jgi:hypothetical protein